MQVVQVNAIVDGPQTDLVCRADGLAAFHAATRHPYREAIRIVVATRASPLAVLSDQVARGNLTVSEAVVELADADELGDLAALIGLGLRMPSEMVVRNLFLGGGETLMLLCRAATLDVDALSAILRMRDRRRCGTKLEPKRLIEDDLRIPHPVAVNVMLTVREQAQVA